LKAANPDGRYVVIEVQEDGQEILKNLEKEYGLPTGIEIIRSGETPVTTAFQDIAESGTLIVHSVQFGDRIPDGRVFAIMEYDERATALAQMTERKDPQDDVFLVVEETAHPIGGMQALYSFLGENISYPAEARQAGVTGRVFIEFIVEKDGTLTNFKTLKGIGHGCDDEAIRALSLSPPWAPGKYKGEVVRQKMVMPVVFSL
jgi:TonB family protein